MAAEVLLAMACAAAAAAVLLVRLQPCALEVCQCSGHHQLQQEWTAHQRARELRSCCAHGGSEPMLLLLHLMAASCRSLFATAALL